MKILYTILYVSCLAITFSQEFKSGIPLSFKNDLRDDFRLLEMQSIDVEALLIEDQNAPSNTPFRFGYPIEQNIDLIKEGTWEETDTGDSVLRLKIVSEGAYSIRTIFSVFKMTDNAELYVYNESQDVLFGAYTQINNQEDLQFSTPLVTGDSMIIELNLNSESNELPELYIDTVVHDYKDFYSFINRDRACGANVVCSEGDPYEDQINSVAYIEMGWSICSGGMVNNLRQDLTPYFLTADHCYSGSPSSYRFYFDYKTSSCSGSNASAGSYVYGAQLKSRSYDMDTDYMLLRLTGSIPSSSNIYYAGWNAGENTSYGLSVGIHHPGGDPKKINFGSGNTYQSNWNGQGENSPYGSHWKVYWSAGGTEGGSSGSPVFDSNKRVLGPLSGGPDVACESNGDYALYGRLTRAWDMGISNYLDPDGTGTRYVNGTYTAQVLGCTDPGASNYNPNATINDGSCEYTSAGTAALTFGQITNNSMQVILNRSVPIAGIQFNVTDFPNVIDITGASGGTMQDYDYNVTTSESGTILGFSFTGVAIPAGQSVITNISFEGSGNTEICLENGVVSNEDGVGLDVSYGACYMFENNLAGDINGDEVVNILDVVSIVNIVLGSEGYTSAADLNDDGIVNILDIIQTVNIILSND